MSNMAGLYEDSIDVQCEIGFRTESEEEGFTVLCSDEGKWVDVKTCDREYKTQGLPVLYVISSHPM